MHDTTERCDSGHQMAAVDNIGHKPHWRDQPLYFYIHYHCIESESKSPVRPSVDPLSNFLFNFATTPITTQHPDKLVLLAGHRQDPPIRPNLHLWQQPTLLWSCCSPSPQALQFSAHFCVPHNNLLYFENSVKHRDLWFPP